MVVQVTRKDGESSDKLLKRFSGHIKSIKLMQKFRGIRYFKQKPRKWQSRDAAVKREEYRAANKKKQYMN